MSEYTSIIILISPTILRPMSRRTSFSIGRPTLCAGVAGGLLDQASISLPLIFPHSTQHVQCMIGGGPGGVLRGYMSGSGEHRCRSLGSRPILSLPFWREPVGIYEAFLTLHRSGEGVLGLRFPEKPGAGFKLNQRKREGYTDFYHRYPRFPVSNIFKRSSILSSPPPATSPSLVATAYHPHWNALLSWELHKLVVEKEQIVIWKTGVKVGDWDPAEFLLLDVGDLLVLREVFEAQKVGSGIAFEGRVITLRKREGLFVLSKGSAVSTPEDVLPLVLKITFVPTARPSFLMDVASKMLHDAMAEPYDTNRCRAARRWLFPIPDDIPKGMSIDLVQRHLPDENWLDTGLNEEQKRSRSERTTVEAVLQILRFSSESCILLSAPSNSGTDTLVMRLRSALQPHELLRLNDPNRTFAEVPTSGSTAVFTSVPF
ncbi:hypothetical protein B0H11DRAFT_2355676 [Mycena galericulata]|nr:hypothetical protein B0H11DRAFT_2355676 [Mycena galericulata]